MRAALITLALSVSGVAWADPPLKVNLKSGPDGVSAEQASPEKANTEKATAEKATAEKAGAVGPLEAPGLGPLPWGADAKAVFKAIPSLRRSAGSVGKVRRLLKSSATVYLPSDEIPWQGRKWFGHVHLGEGGLFKVVMRQEIGVGEGEAFIEKWLPGLGEATTDADGRRIWRGGKSALVVQIQPLGMEEQIIITLIEIGHFSGPGLSLGID